MRTQNTPECLNKATTLTQISIDDLNLNSVYSAKHREVITLLKQRKTPAQIMALASISYSHIRNILNEYNISPPTNWTNTKIKSPLSADHQLLGERLLALRLAKSITSRTQLQYLSGVSAQKISNIESGLVDAPFSILLKLTSAMDTPLPELFSTLKPEELAHNPQTYETELTNTPTFDSLTENSTPEEVAQAERELGIKRRNRKIKSEENSDDLPTPDS